jgi:hypothetical protein
LYVQKVYLEKSMEPSVELLLEFFKLSYVKTFGNSDFRSKNYKDGVKMLTAWFERTSFEGFEVISTEKKKNFPIPVMIDGVKDSIPFNYVLDRFDRLGETKYRVVDYKTNIMPLSPSDLRDKPQARCYALAMQIEHKDATQIWVEFDMLRHDGPVGVTYTREDNVETWKWIKAEAQRIIDTPTTRIDKQTGEEVPAKLPETLNPECNFCIRKTTCETVTRNIENGGVLSLGMPGIADRRAMLENQKKAAAAAIEEIDRVLLAEAKVADVDLIKGDDYDLAVGVSKRRGVDAERLVMVLADSPNLIRKYTGGATITMRDYDALLSDPELTEDQRRHVSGLVSTRYGEPSIRVKKKPTIRSK